MKTKLILLTVVLTLISCTKKENFDVELISYYWSIKVGQPKDSIVPYVRCALYAQINRNGDCTLTRTRNDESDLLVKFKIKREILDSALQIIDKINSDTVMSKRCYGCFYEGPTIKLIGKNTTGLSHSIRYSLSNRSNTHLVDLYNYIDSTSRKMTTTDKFMKSKENRTKKIFEKEIKSIIKPVIVSDNEVEE